MDPLTEQWFNQKYGTPTFIQKNGWEAIQKGEHLLITAPTGSGKTLAAFLWGLDQLITGEWPTGGIKLLYISPLKALNNDIKENLLSPLEELRALFCARGRFFPDIAVRVRSGDTPSSERQKVYRHPPDIFITTPESLNILITSKQGRKLFGGLKTVILDEIHSVLGSKRGTHLITAVERLTLLAGEVQRIALSATVPDIQAAARFVGGYLPPPPGSDEYIPRPVTLIRSPDEKKNQLNIVSPPEYQVDQETQSGWMSLANELLQRIQEKNTTIIFSGSRRHSEKIARFINDQAEQELVFAHHGSLSRELRHEVEKGLKSGRIQAVSATSSLELGIDIGTVDQVILLGTPFSVSSALQRVGRAGHQVGALSYGLLYPTHGRDFLEAASLMEPFNHKTIEPIPIPRGSLDMLAQIILAMALPEKWIVSNLYRFIRQIAPYHDLSFTAFEAVLEMLCGRYADSRIRELSARLSRDRLEDSIKTYDGAAWLLYTSGGSIPDRGYYELRTVGGKERLGELDEEFVWERRVGDRFVFGNRPWRIVKIGHKSVEAEPEHSDQGMIPFWKADSRYQPHERCAQTARFLDDWKDRLDEEDIVEQLSSSCRMNKQAAERLRDFLLRQKDAAGLPGRRHLILEHYQDPDNKDGSKQVILYTLWGGQVNGPFAYAFAQSWQEQYGYPLQTSYSDDGIAFELPHTFSAADLWEQFSAEDLDGLLRRYLEKTPFFGARFRGNAARALLLPKGSPKKRMPLWMTRLRSKKLLQAVLPYPDFPVTAETWRECLEECFQIDILKQKLDEIKQGLITVSEVQTTQASPLSGGLIFQFVNKYMYEDDTALSDGVISATDDAFLEQVLKDKTDHLISDELNRELAEKLLGAFPGYLPPFDERCSETEKQRFYFGFLEKLKEMLFILPREAQCIFDKRGQTIILPPKAARQNICGQDIIFAKEREKDLRFLLQNTESSLTEDQAGQWLNLFSEWMMGRSLLISEEVKTLFPLLKDQNSGLWDTLTTPDGNAVKGFFLKGEKREQITDRENLNRLLRMRRRKESPVPDPLPLCALPGFLAGWQGLYPLQDKGGRVDSDPSGRLRGSLEKLLCLPIPARHWEGFVLPSRVAAYREEWLDTLLRKEEELIWYGKKRQKIGFTFRDELSLCSLPAGHDEEDYRQWFLDPLGRYPFTLLTQRAGLPSHVVLSALWDGVWQSRITAAGMGPLRGAVSQKFRFQELVTPQEKAQRSMIPGSRRSRYAMWKSSRPVGSTSGEWQLLPKDAPDVSDLLEERAEQRERIWLLFDRYGLLFREILEKEDKENRWYSVYRTLQLMELAGECFSGYFFTDIPGPQFISGPALHEFRQFHQEPEEPPHYFMNAADPASLCGAALPLLKSQLPARRENNWIGIRGQEMFFIVSANGKSVEIPRFTETEKDESSLLLFIREMDLFFRSPYPGLKKITIELINGRSPGDSPLLPFFLKTGYSLIGGGELLSKRKPVIGL